MVCQVSFQVPASKLHPLNHSYVYLKKKRYLSVRNIYPSKKERSLVSGMSRFQNINVVNHVLVLNLDVNYCLLGTVLHNLIGNNVLHKQ